MADSIEQFDGRTLLGAGWGAAVESDLSFFRGGIWISLPLFGLKVHRVAFQGVLHQPVQAFHVVGGADQHPFEVRFGFAPQIKETLI